MDVPETRYATSGAINIAYQVFGDGPLDVVLVWGGISHIEVMWEMEGFARFFERLASFARVIHFDRRGIGLSDRVGGVATLEERMDDVRTVMHAASSERAAILGESEGGPMCVLFAATYPERTVALIPYAPIVCFVGDDAFPWAPIREVYEQSLAAMCEGWGNGISLDTFAPSMVGDPAARSFAARFERYAATPASFRDQMTMNAGIDIRPILSSVKVPTLVIHRRGDVMVRVEQGRYLAEHVEGARFVELDGIDHLLGAGDPDIIADEIEQFLTGRRREAEPDRVLATIVFTDIVDSTTRAATIGDRSWRELLDRHDRVARDAVEKHRGQIVKATGDGVLATFDGPARAIQCSVELRAKLRDLGVDITAGVHTGEIERRSSDIGGIGVHIAARVESAARPGEVLVSRTVKDLVAGSDMKFENRGDHDLKGLPDRWQLFAVV
jgi:class 3 adenylate cyclase